MVLFINTGDTSRHTSSANTAIYPNLGLLTLMSALHEKSNSSITLGYLDGTVYGNPKILDYILTNGDNISIICFSVLTSNYGVSLEIAKKAKEKFQEIIIIMGNDHFSALYKQTLTSNSFVDYGFYGNDVVLSFTQFILDIKENKITNYNSYAGLVYREGNNIKKKSEDPSEYSMLPLVKYNLVDTIFPHQEKYFAGQNNTYSFMRNRNLRSQVIDIGRGCVKFSGRRYNDVPLNACDFCGIIPGIKAVTYPSHERAWEIIRNAFEQGFNYLYVTADELPLTMWNMLKLMAENLPGWYKNLDPKNKPKMFGYARAEAFITSEDKVDILINKLGFDHFFIGFDGLSEISLKVMNKQPIKDRGHNLMDYNQYALKKLGQAGCLITAGLVVTHLGITEEILEENFIQLKKFVESYPSAFAALDFGPLCPIPGSQSFMYFTNPDFAQKKADEFGLNINIEYLYLLKDKYEEKDLLDMDELIDDFILGCCPDINKEIVNNHMNKISDLAKKHKIVIGGGV